MESGSECPPLNRHFRKAESAKRLPPCRTTTVPVSLRLTFEQKARLNRDAAGMSQSSYIRWTLPASLP
jgi:hypothetical protein